MAKRRAAGEGTLYLDKASGRWFGQVTMPEGRKTVSAKTQKECRAKLKRLLEAKEKGLPVPSERLTVCEYLTGHKDWPARDQGGFPLEAAGWLGTVVRPSVRPSAYARYETNVRVWLVPQIGHRRLAGLSVADVQAMVSRLAATVSPSTGRVLAPRTVNNILVTLHGALQVALEQGLVYRNVTDVVHGQKVERAAVQAPTAEESIRLLQAASGNRLEGLVTLALTTGLRLGELVGLTWEDVDEAEGMIRVRRQRTRVPGHGLTESAPKTERSRRPVILTAMGLRALERQRRLNEALREAAGERWRETGIGFANTKDGPIEPRLVHLGIKALGEKAGIGEVHPHMLRHSTATLLYALKVPPKTIQEILGHTSIALTSDIYTDSVPAHHQEAMKALDGLLSGWLHTSPHNGTVGAAR